MALLEADVALPVVRDFIARVKEKALARRWWLAQPGLVLVSIVQKELAATMGEGVATSTSPLQPPAVDPDGRPARRRQTTTTAKLAST